MSAAAKERLVVVGFGMATVRFLEELAAGGTLGPDGRYAITVIGDEPHLAYNRVLLCSVLEGSFQPESTVMRSRAWYELLGITLVTGRRAVELDRHSAEVELEDGERIGFDVLVLATGGSPVLPPVRGALTSGGQLHPKVVAFRTLDDCARLLDAIEPGQNAVVVGGGLLGLEAARGLVRRGLTVDVVEVAEHLLNTQLEAEPAKVLRRAVTLLGIGVHTGVRAVALAGDDTELLGVRPGRQVPAGRGRRRPRLRRPAAGVAGPRGGPRDRPRDRRRRPAALGHGPADPRAGGLRRARRRRPGPGRARLGAGCRPGEGPRRRRRRELHGAPPGDAAAGVRPGRRGARHA